jgi:deoxyribodipyrimidine photo-lyase
MTRGIVLHHRHLRQVDHAALAEAATNHETVVPVFVFDPHFYQGDSLACNARIRFMHECLDELDISLFHGNPAEVVSSLDGDVYTIHTATGRYGVERNKELYDAGVTFVQGDGLRRCENPRNGWSDAIEEWLTDDTFDKPDCIEPVESEVSIEWVEDEYDISSQKEQVPTGGRRAALDQLHEFCDSPEYWGHISEPTRERGVSDLSTYLRFGCLSIRETYQRVSERLSGHDKNAIQSRLFWNLHYQQKLLDWPGWMDEAVNPELRQMGTPDENKWTRFKNGRTGYPMVDAAVRQLTNTGWLNFRNRALLATFHSNLLNLPWKQGADWLYYHLIDADPGINYTQWQSQTSRVGTNLYRIYNPRKQVRDSDEATEWIQEWVPELRGFPEQHLDQPEKTPLSVQESCGIIIGEDYPLPVVEYEAARSRARRRLEQREAAAVEALEDPEVREWASLSARGRGRQPDVESLKQDSTQQSLADFS